MLGLAPGEEELLLLGTAQLWWEQLNQEVQEDGGELEPRCGDSTDFVVCVM